MPGIWKGNQAISMLPAFSLRLQRQIWSDFMCAPVANFIYTWAEESGLLHRQITLFHLPIFKPCRFKARAVSTIQWKACNSYIFLLALQLHITSLVYFSSLFKASDKHDIIIHHSRLSFQSVLLLKGSTLFMKSLWYLFSYTVKVTLTK